MTKPLVVVNISYMRAIEIKARILGALRESGDCLSGQALSLSLGVSRASIWTHIQALRRDGYIIGASSRGYRLISSPDLLLPYEFPGWEHRIHYLRETGSTMDAARELAGQGASEGTVVVAESQTHGRGRLGREWLSPRGGIYLTIILRPATSPVYAPRANLMASVAVAKAINRLYGIKAELKWPNDVLIEGAKVCGILAEMQAERDALDFVNIGIGINANVSLAGLENTATSLQDVLGREICRRQLLAALLSEIERRQSLLMEEDLLDEWRRLSATLNRDVRIVVPGEAIVGRAIDVDATGALIIGGRDGSLRKAVAGDCIHLRHSSTRI